MRPIVQEHPTGLAVTLTAAIVLIFRRVDVELSEEESVVLVGLVGAIVSALTPRFRRS